MCRTRLQLAQQVVKYFSKAMMHSFLIVELVEIKWDYELTDSTNRVYYVL
jgi:hypothetical protein